MKRTLATLCLALLLTGSAIAQTVPVPSLLNFQGKLTKPDGTPVADGPYDIRFSLWDAGSGGTEKWNQTLLAVNSHNGLFAVLLNTSTPNLFDNNLWLEIKVGTDTPLTPRQQLVSVAYALKANTVPDNSITSAKIHDVDWTKVINAPSLPFSLPFSGIADTPDAAFQITNHGSNAIAGITDYNGYAGLYGRSLGQSGFGIIGQGANYSGGGFFSSESGNGIYSYAFGRGDTSIGNGVNGFSFAPGGYGGYFQSTHSHGVVGESTNGANGAGVYGISRGDWSAVYGNAQGLNGSGVQGVSSGNGPGVYGVANGYANGGYFTSNQANGVVGESYGPGAGVIGVSNSGNYGGYFLNRSGGTALFADGTAQMRVLEILGGADLAEKFEMEGAVKPGMVVEIDPDHEGGLRLSTGAYNKRVAGIVSGAKNLSAGVVLTDPNAKNQHAQPIAMSGRVWVYCDATEKAIEPGDLLTTAERPGHAMAVSDASKSQGTILGKAMSRLAKGKVGLVLVLVNLQ